MHTDIASLASAVAMLAAAFVYPGAASAGPSQDDQFLDLLAKSGIPAVDGTPGLIDRAHEICAELSGGTAFSVVIDEEMEAAFQENPILHLMPGRVRRTEEKFINAAVGAYCPENQVKSQ